MGRSPGSPCARWYSAKTKPKATLIGKMKLGVRQSAIQSTVLYGPFYRVDVNGAWKLITPLVLDVTFEDRPELRFHFVIFPKDGEKLTGGAAYAKGDSTKSIPFHIYPAKQYADRATGTALNLYNDTRFNYSCVYYGTEGDGVVDALMDRPEKIPDVVLWKNYATLIAEVARLENEATKPKEEIEELERKVAKSKEEIEELERNAAKSKEQIEELERKAAKSKDENEELKKEGDRLQAKDDKLKAVVKAVVDVIEDLKKDDNKKTPNTDNKETSTDDEENPATE